MRIVLVHGFNVKDGGAGSIDRLAPHLEKRGHEVECDEADYGYYDLIKVRFAKYSAVRRILGALNRADAVVTHSNGANYATKALNLFFGQRVQVIHLSPALNSDTKVPSNISRGWVFFTKTDWTVWISSLLIGHAWGRMGQRGYTGGDPRITNIDHTDLVKFHSDWFNDDNVEIIAAEIDSLLRKPL